MATAPTAPLSPLLEDFLAQLELAERLECSCANRSHDQ
jgi:hypothetical protein